MPVMASKERTPGGHGDVIERPVEKTEAKTQEPELFAVFLLNDDYTTMEFVVEVLEAVFLKSPAEANGIMMHVHQHGKGLAGIYPYEVAETKAATTRELARANGFPLEVTVEPAPAGRNEG